MIGIIASRFFVLAGFGEGTPQQDSTGVKFGAMVASCSITALQSIAIADPVYGPNFC